jgi:hypothetical protein
MTTPHRATPEQWASQKAWAVDDDDSACLIDLHARVEALEAAQQDKLDRLIALDAADPTPDPATRLHSYKVAKAEPIEGWGKGHTPVNPEAPMTELRAASAEAPPAGGLVERVAEAMQPGTFDWSAYEDEARAAIREVATWLDRFALHGSGEYAQAAKVLRQEVGQ